MPRLFTGLEIPASIASSLSGLRGGLSGAKWIDPESHHVTLRFIGDVDEPTADALAEELSRLSRPRFELRIDGLIAFGGRQPHSLVARITPTPALIELQAEHERLCRRLGLPPEPRRFTPHVTIARCKNLSHDSVAAWLAARGGPAGLAWTPERVVLWSSKASRGGGPYVVEGAWPLAAARPDTPPVDRLGRAAARLAPIAARFHPRFATTG